LDAILDQMQCFGCNTRSNAMLFALCNVCLVVGWVSSTCWLYIRSRAQVSSMLEGDWLGYFIHFGKCIEEDGQGEE